MKQLNEYLISFSGLKLGKHQFDYQIDNSFFEGFNYNDFNTANVQTKVILNKKSTILELFFSHKGTITVPCDVTNEPFDLPIKGKLDLVVKFGDFFNDDNEELLILPHGEHQLNISQYIYEMIVLSIPPKRVHPDVEDGTLDSKALYLLEDLAPKKEKKERKTDTDPRWDKLKTLLTDK